MTLCRIAILLTSILIAGCATGPVHIYEGKPRQDSELASIRTVTDIPLNREFIIAGKSITRGDKAMVLPGDYTIKVKYYSRTGLTHHYFDIPISVEAGKAYTIQSTCIVSRSKDWGDKLNPLHKEKWKTYIYVLKPDTNEYWGHTPPQASTQDEVNGYGCKSDSPYKVDWSQGFENSH